MNIEIQNAVEQVRIVDSDRNYWFIRTYGGEMFHDFINREYVGIGLNEVPYNYVKDYREEDQNTYDRIKNFVESNTSYKKGEATKWTNQLINFQHNVQKGDLVIIPNKNSSYFHIGVVESDVFVVNEDITFYHDNTYKKFPDKRRKIRWEKYISKYDVRSDLRGMTSTHQAITGINKYADGIEGHISSIYVKEDKMHLIINIDQDQDINAFDLNDFLSTITYFYKEFSEEENGPIEDLTIKIKLQSKGKMALKGVVKGGILGIALLVLLSDNNEFKAEIGNNKFSFESDGLISTISEFLDENQERKMQYRIFQDSMESLKAKVVQDTTNLTNDEISDNPKENRETNDSEDNSDQE